MRGWLIGLVAAAVAASAAAEPATAPSAQTVYVMRHLQTEESQSDPALTAEGRAQALALAARLVPERPAAIFATATRRAQQTAQPLSEKTGVAIAAYDPFDTPGLVARVRAQRGTVLVVGHSNTVPEIVAALGGVRPAPIGHDQFGEVWQVRLPAGDTTSESLGEAARRQP